MLGRGVFGQGGDRSGDQGASSTNPFVVSGLAGQVREHVTQMSAGVTDPAGLGIELEQVLGDDQAQQLGIGELGFTTADMSPGQADPGQDSVIEKDVQCGQEGVEFVVHTKGLTSSAYD